MAFSEKGYTAIELLVVIALMAIMAVLGVANLTAQTSRYRLSNAGRQIVSHLRLIRQKAVTEGRSHAIQLDPAEGKYSLPGLGEQTLPAGVRFGTAPDIGLSPGGNSELPEDGVSFNGNRITFQPNGTFAGIGGTIYLTHASSRRENLAITVNMTGRVKLYRWAGNGWE